MHDVARNGLNSRMGRFKRNSLSNTHLEPCNLNFSIADWTLSYVFSNKSSKSFELRYFSLDIARSNVW